jgi:hypothetical protein
VLALHATYEMQREKQEDVVIKSRNINAGDPILLFQRPAAANTTERRHFFAQNLFQPLEQTTLKLFQHILVTPWQSRVRPVVLLKD